MNAGGRVSLRLTTDHGAILAEKVYFTHFGMESHAIVRGGPVQNFQVEFDVTALSLFREYTN